MVSRSSLLFCVVLALLFTHEVDAALREEWRLLYVLRIMESERAAQWFIAIHLPLFALILWLSFHRKETIQSRSRNVIALFAIVHAGLHWRLKSDPLSAFDGALSWSIIYGAALAGVMYLCVIRARSRQ